VGEREHDRCSVGFCCRVQVLEPCDMNSGAAAHSGGMIGVGANYVEEREGIDEAAMRRWKARTPSSGRSSPTSRTIANVAPAVAMADVRETQ